MENVCSINNFVRCLTAGGMNPDLANLISLLLGVVLVATLPLLTVILLIWVERKVAARVQDRLGPNRVGPLGLLQTIADALKMLTKEDITPLGADKFIYNLAPIIAFGAVPSGETTPVSNFAISCAVSGRTTRRRGTGSKLNTTAPSWSTIRRTICGRMSTPPLARAAIAQCT